MSHVWKRGEFVELRALLTINLGPLGREIHEGSTLLTDGFQVKFDGQTFEMPTFRMTVDKGWFCFAGDLDAEYTPERAIRPLHSPVPDRQGKRREIPIDIYEEDHQTVGAVVDARIGARSERSRDLKREATSEVGRSHETSTGQEGQVVRSFTASKKKGDRTQITAENAATVVGKVHREVEARVHSMGVDSLTSKKVPSRGNVGVDSISSRAGEDARPRGQAVGVDGFVSKPPSTRRSESDEGDLNVPVAAPRLADADAAEYAEFMAFKKAKADKAKAQEVEARRLTRLAASGDKPLMEIADRAPPSAGDFTWEMEGVQWQVRANTAIEKFGNDPEMLEQILSVETPGVVKRIKAHLNSE